MANGLKAYIAGGGVPGLLAERFSPGSTSGLQSLFFGSPEQTKQLSRYSPEIQSQLDEILGSLLGQFKEGGIGGFEPIEAKAREGFAQKTLPGIAERFTAMGGGGGRSSAFTQALGQAGAGLESTLAGLRSQHGMRNLQALLGLGQQEPLLQQQQPGFLETGASSLLQLLPLLAML
jgi:hypothetical protein